MASLVVISRSAYSFSRPVPELVSPEPIRNVATINSHRRLNLAQVREEYREACKECVWFAFKGDSRSAKAKEAARHIIGEHPDTFRRIMAGGTLGPDAPLMAVVAGYYFRATGKQSPVMRLFAQLAGEA